MIEFIRFSKQWYWEANRKCGLKDDITIQDNMKGGEVEWEFRIRGGCQGKPITIRFFEDGVKALKDKMVVNALIDVEGCESLDDVERILIRHKFKEVIEKEKNG